MNLKVLVSYFDTIRKIYKGETDINSELERFKDVSMYGDIKTEDLIEDIKNFSKYMPSYKFVFVLFGGYRNLDDVFSDICYDDIDNDVCLYMNDILDYSEEFFVYLTAIDVKRDMRYDIYLRGSGSYVKYKLKFLINNIKKYVVEHRVDEEDYFNADDFSVYVNKRTFMDLNNFLNEYKNFDEATIICSSNEKPISISLKIYNLKDLNINDLNKYCRIMEHLKDI